MHCFVTVNYFSKELRDSNCCKIIFFVFFHDQSSGVFHGDTFQSPVAVFTYCSVCLCLSMLKWLCFGWLVWENTMFTCNVRMYYTISSNKHTVPSQRQYTLAITLCNWIGLLVNECAFYWPCPKTFLDPVHAAHDKHRYTWAKYEPT